MIEDVASIAGVVLVVTTPGDATAEAVEAQLYAMATPTARIDLGDFPNQLRIAVRHSDTGWRVRLWTEDVCIDVDRIRSVYYRRPTRFRMPAGLSDGDTAFAMAEARLGFGGALATLHALWVNHPAKVAVAEYKPVQLMVAAESGMVVPRTIITNDHDELRAFADALDGPVICKAFSSLVLNEGPTAQTVYTTFIDPQTIDPQQLAATAHLVQEWVPKAFEVRVTMVGRTPYAAAIHAGSDAGHVDWRSDYGSLTYESIDTPPDVAKSMCRYLDVFELNYGAFDFVVEPDGAWRFLECNPNGQWLWLEHETGLPIARALATLLTGAEPY